jgi:hypothetical protein
MRDMTKFDTSTTKKNAAVKLLRGKFLLNPNKQIWRDPVRKSAQQGRHRSPQNNQNLMNLFIIQKGTFDCQDSRQSESANMSQLQPRSISRKADKSRSIDADRQPTLFGAKKHQESDHHSSFMSSNDKTAFIKLKLQKAHEQAEKPDEKTRHYLDSLVDLVMSLCKRKTRLSNNNSAASQAIQKKEEENLKLISHLGLLEKKKSRLKEMQTHKLSLAKETERIKSATRSLMTKADVPQLFPGLLESSAMKLSLVFASDDCHDLVCYARSLEKQLNERTRLAS